MDWFPGNRDLCERLPHPTFVEYNDSVPQSETTPHLIRLGPQGRLVIPSDLRKALCVKPGDALVACLDGDRLVLRPRRALEEELWAMFQNVEGSLADDLIRERREEARRESEE